jgi:hypothetical protein
MKLCSVFLYLAIIIISVTSRSETHYACHCGTNNHYCTDLMEVDCSARTAKQIDSYNKTEACTRTANGLNASAGVQRHYACACGKTYCTKLYDPKGKVIKDFNRSADCVSLANRLNLNIWCSYE